MMFNFFKEKIYITKTPTFDEALAIVAGQLASDEDVDEQTKETRRVFKDLVQVEGLEGYLRMTLTKDISRYFMAINDDERSTIRGAFARTAYFLNKLRKERLDK